MLRLQQTLYSSRNPTRRWLHCTRRDWIIEALHRYSPKGSNEALEIGPGSGVYLPVLSHLFQKVTAIDIEETFLKHAEELTRKYSNVSLFADDIRDSRLPSERFDLVLCSEVIEHLGDARKAMKEMHRLLKPQGILILTTPQRYSILELVAKIAFLPGIINIVSLIYRESILETGHINLMTEGEVMRHLEASRFHLLECYKSGLYLPLLAEFMGQPALRMEKWLESRMKIKPFFRHLVWTQYFIAEA